MSEVVRTMVQGQICKHIFAPDGGYCLYYPSNLLCNARSFENSKSAYKNTKKNCKSFKLDKSIAVSVGMTAIKSYLSICLVGLVWLASREYCGKTYSRHLFCYGGFRAFRGFFFHASAVKSSMINIKRFSEIRSSSSDVQPPCFLRTCNLNLVFY